MAAAETSPAMTAEVVVQELPAQDYLGVRFTSALEDVGRDVQDGFRRLYGLIAQTHSTPTGPPFLIASEPKEGSMELEVGAPCAPVPRTTAGLHVGRLDAGRAVVALHRGRYEDIGPVYAQIFNWVGEHGYSLRGAAREVYLNGPNEVKSPDHYLTQLVVPVQMSASRTKRSARSTKRRGSDAAKRPSDPRHDVPVGVQGANFGYWQAVGATRSAAKRAKRP